MQRTGFSHTSDRADGIQENTASGSYRLESIMPWVEDWNISILLQQSTLLNITASLLLVVLHTQPWKNL